MKGYIFKGQQNWLITVVTFIAFLGILNVQGAYRVLGINKAGNLLQKDGITNTDFMGPVGKWTVINAIPGGATNAKYVTIGKDGVIWLLTKDNGLYRTYDLKNWEVISVTPPGGITQMDAGVYTLVAINPEGKLFYLKGLIGDISSGLSWETLEAPGALINISISSSGKLWGVDKNQNAYNRAGIESPATWNKVNGNLTKVSVGIEGTPPWGVNTSSKRFSRWDGNQFIDISGISYNNVMMFGVDIAKGDENQIWVVHNEPDSSGDYAVFYFKQNTGWVQAGGRIVQIAVGALSSPLVIPSLSYQALAINNQGNLYKKTITNAYFAGTPGTWAQISDLPGGGNAAKYVTIGSNKIVWLWTKYNKLFVTKDLSKWEQVVALPPGGTISQMSAGNDTLAAVTPDGKAYYLKDISKDNPSGSQWEPLTGNESFSSISVSLSGKLWAAGKDGADYKRDGLDAQFKWNKINGSLTQISVGLDDIPCGTDSGKKLYELSGDTWNDLSTQTNFSGSYITKQLKSQIWALSNTPDTEGNYPLYYRGSNMSWVQDTGKFIQVAVEPPTRQLTIVNSEKNTLLTVRVIDKLTGEKVLDGKQIYGKDTINAITWSTDGWDCPQYEDYCTTQFKTNTSFYPCLETKVLLYGHPYTISIEKKSVTVSSVPKAPPTNVDGSQIFMSRTGAYVYTIGNTIKNYTYEIPADNLTKTIIV